MKVHPLITCLSKLYIYNEVSKDISMSSQKLCKCQKRPLPIRWQMPVQYHLQCKSRKHEQKGLHRPNRTPLQAEIFQPHIINQAQEIWKQHGTIEICLAIEERRCGIQNYLVNKPKSTGLLQQNKVVQPLPN